MENFKCKRKKDIEMLLKLQRKYIVGTNLKDSKYYLSLKSGDFNPRELKPCSSQNYHIGGVTPVLYPSNNSNNKHTKLTEEKVKQKNLNKLQFKSLPQASDFSIDAKTKYIRKPSILERIERNELNLKKKLKSDIRIYDCKRTFSKCIIKKAKTKTEFTYLLPELKKEIEMKDIKKVIFNKPSSKLNVQFYNNSEIRLVANNFFKWMESIGEGGPYLTVSSLYSLLLNSFEIKPSLAINLQIIDEKELGIGFRRCSTELESFTFGHENPSYVEYFDNRISKKELLRFEKLFSNDE
ncbi:uncharacterized protein LOC106874699 [Octopus bimaculoides]|uniref:Uncharacterized protein n=1 Tax=Octopus bimaculoides TaxID=37653 RepID=A0A0L8GTV3_OCTBM|nr:uncharacterized protein LOC106874699 [Octopus bimaculoides]XP_014777994.1 uncharacterized protein LOC106874699 [Octopus bimaculoides]XP_014777995.1 uncharacterized protein LOC106874699 [Octopus bimaculoides]XP_052823056.1 uncharacterized protein LOC106874699 [Octopus bimaculoides]|eukprot:XP_014777993.1 PREDICTED: uncharacterized protein LOC106874699 [Octopus bimaculoides]